jgi:hypothetical protein
VGELKENGTIEEILALAAKYPEMEGEILTQAMRQAESAGDYERAQKIANDYSGDPELRQRLKERTEIYGVDTARTEAHFAQLQEELAELPLEMQIESLISFANHAAPNDRKSSLKALNQVKAIVDNLKPGAEQIRGQIIIAAIYCLAESDQGFAIVEAILPKLNELIAAGARLDGFDTHYLRDGEWNMSADGEIGKLLTFLARNASYFAWHDFDRAMSLAAQFERGEIRMMAQLKLAQGILTGRRKRLPKGPELY